MYNENEIDYTKLKYVLYARKSTDDPKRQLRSISDQISECLELAERLHLRVVKPYITEEKSAKKPHLRPAFLQMVRDIKAGKYDAILAWNPDRLARNMLEAGMLIDLADNEVIKDFKFVTHVYSPDANGKMLLGMAFVLSKQYSDKLSQDVTRGVRNRFILEGKTPISKHGYVNESGNFRPDGQNYELIKKAWLMRKEGTSIEDINEYLNQNGYFKVVKSSGRKIPMTKQKLSDLFHDPFYYGILVQAKQEVDLRQLYGFEPAVSEEDFFTIQQLSYRRIKPNKQHKVGFYPFRQMVYCSYCESSMVVAPSSGSSKRYLYFRCDNPNCTRKKRSIRAKIVVDFIYNLLHDGLNFTEKEYKDYLKSITVISDKKRESLRLDLHNRQGVLKHISGEIKTISLKLVKFEKGSRVYQENMDRIAQLEDEERTLKKNINKLGGQLRDPEEDKLSIEQFLNLSKNAEGIVQSADEKVKDLICRFIFLNFSVDDEKVASYQLKEPFATLLKQRQSSSSRDDWT